MTNDYKQGYNEALKDVKAELKRMTLKGYQFPLLHIFEWIDKNIKQETI